MSDQGELFDAEVSWFHVFRDMIESGDVAKIGPHATTVYLVIKAHTNWSTGSAFPSIETIAKKSGISSRKIKDCLKDLEVAGYIRKEKRGRSNLYTLREKVEIIGGDGRPQAVASWDYLPATVKGAVADLKNVMASGDFADAKVVHIENLNVQMNFASGDNATFNQSNVASEVAELLAHADTLEDPKVKQLAISMAKKMAGKLSTGNGEK